MLTYFNLAIIKEVYFLACYHTKNQRRPIYNTELGEFSLCEGEFIND